MWADMQSAALTANYRSPLLTAHTVDPATGQLQRTLFTYARLGIVVKGHLGFDPKVVSLTPPSNPQFASLHDCLDGTHWLTYYAATGRLTDNRPGTRTQLDATLRLVAGQWRVSSYTIHLGEHC
jgi:hypothetical protein